MPFLSGFGKADPKKQTFTRPRAHLDFPTMDLGNPVDQRQPYPVTRHMPGTVSTPKKIKAPADFLF